MVELTLLLLPSTTVLCSLVLAQTGESEFETEKKIKNEQNNKETVNTIKINNIGYLIK